MSEGAPVPDALGATDPPSPKFAGIGRTALTVAASSLGGWGAFRLGIPLPWVLGAMAGTAAVTLAGCGAKQPVFARRAAQITIGTALGLTFTQEVIRQVVSLGGFLVAGAAFAVLLTMAFARVLQKMAGIDGPTAIYSVAVGASAEMARQAQEAGADGALVASAHAIRIILVVCLASVVAHWSGEQPSPIIGTAVPLLPWRIAGVFVFAAPLCGWLANGVRMPNGWLLGPVIMAGSVAATGITAKLYPEALVVAQIAIGWGLGQHMTMQFFVKSPRTLLCSAVVTLAMLVICVAVAWGLGHVGGISLLTAFLALAPGGTAEMAIIAKNYGIGAPIVTTFHFFRVVTIIVSIKYVSAFLTRHGWVTPTARR